MPCSFFVIVGRNDCPLYELEFASAKKEDQSQLKQFILHSSLDIVDELLWSSNNLFGIFSSFVTGIGFYNYSCSFFKTIDKFNDNYISVFVTASYVKFMLLHDSTNDKRNEDSIRAFFNEVHELYLKIQLNPFYEINSPIKSKSFDLYIKKLAAKHLNN